MELSARAFEYERAGETVVHFQVGEPDFATCEPIRAAACAALDRGLTKYTDADGIPELKAAIAGHYRAVLGCPVPDEAVLGSKYELEIATEMVAATPHFGPLYDPKMARIRS